MDKKIKNLLTSECNELRHHLLQSLSRGSAGVQFNQLNNFLEIIQTEFQKFEDAFIIKLNLHSDQVSRKEVHKYTARCAKECLAELGNYE